jgi:hypothetical protein
MHYSSLKHFYCRKYEQYNDKNRRRNVNILKKCCTSHETIKAATIQQNNSGPGSWDDKPWLNKTAPVFVRQQVLIGSRASEQNMEAHLLKPLATALTDVTELGFTHPTFYSLRIRKKRWLERDTDHTTQFGEEFYSLECQIHKTFF